MRQLRLSLFLFAPLFASGPLSGCGEPSTEDKCLDVCEVQLTDCGAEIDCDEACAQLAQGGCLTEQDRVYDCVLEVSDDLSEEEICAQDGSNALAFAPCNGAQEELTACYAE